MGQANQGFMELLDNPFHETGYPGRPMLEPEHALEAGNCKKKLAFSIILALLYFIHPLGKKLRLILIMKISVMFRILLGSKL